MRKSSSKSPEIKTPAVNVPGAAEAGPVPKHARIVAGRQAYCDLLTTRTSRAFRLQDRSEMAAGGRLHGGLMALGIFPPPPSYHIDPAHPRGPEARAEPHHRQHLRP